MPARLLADDVSTGGTCPTLPNIVDPLAKLSPALLPLWRAVHLRLSSGTIVSRVRPGPLTVQQREAIADLLGLPRLPGEEPSVSIADLDNALSEALGCDIREVVTRLIGPIGDRAGERELIRTQRAELWRWCTEHPVVRAQPALLDWVESVRRGGLFGGSVEQTRHELDRVLRVLDQLPAAGEPLPAFADSVLRDTHALDDGTRCGGLVQRALATIYGIPPPADASERRALWEQAGIADDDLSSTVLVAGLVTAGDDIVSRVLQVCREAGHAAVVTLQQLGDSPTPRVAPDRVWIVENPSLLAMALHRFGKRCPPLVCTAGWPSSAGILLLRRLHEAGSLLLYHGDFDGEGVRIAANVMARTGARPWRMSSADYVAAVADGPPVGRVTAAPWDAELAAHLSSVGVTVAEERVASTLIDELTDHATAG
jgi:uncharacterized protein (TIGR02679 family)